MEDAAIIALYWQRGRQASPPRIRSMVSSATASPATFSNGTGRRLRRLM